MGWMHFREGEFVQVRTRKGGGTRKESAPKNSKKQNLIEKAVQLFFPGGKNAEGSLTDFDIDLTDFQKHSLEDSITVRELYEKTKLPLLHFYLTMKKTDIASDINLEEWNSDATTQESEKTHDRPDIYRHSSDTSVTDAVEVNTSDFIYVGSSTVKKNASSESVSLLYATVDPHVNQRERVKKIIVLDHGEILIELIQVFKCSFQVNIFKCVLRKISWRKSKFIYFQVILPDGKLEKAVDDGGVLRDVLSEFWNDFMSSGLWEMSSKCHTYVMILVNKNGKMEQHACTC